MARQTTLGELERAVMAALWDNRAGLSAREVQAAVAPPPLAVTTVLTVLDRLGSKQLVRREAEGRAHRYFAVSSRADFLSQLMSDVLDQSDDRAAVLARFVGSIPAEDTARLRRLLRGGRSGER
jgi:predicted transcriptional regulator